MKKLTLLVLLILPFIKGYSQASQLLTSQATVQPISSPNLVWIDKTPGQLNRIYVANVDSLKLKVYQLPWVLDSVTNWGDIRYPQLAATYTNPSWVNTLSASKVFGLSSVATTGDYLDLTNRPNLSIFYLNSNPNGYISGITSGMVNAAYGYVPYSSFNPSGYLSSVSWGIVSGKPAIVDSTDVYNQLQAKYPLSGNPSGFLQAGALSPYLLKADTAGHWLPIGTTIPAAQVNTDWNSSGGVSQLLNKPTLSTVATSGSYSDLSNKPTNLNQFTNGPGYLTSEVDGDPNNEKQSISILGRVITLNLAGGSVTVPIPVYDSIPGKPTIPAQVSLSGGKNTSITGSYPNIIVSDSLTNSFYNGSGKINQNIKTWVGTVTPSTGNGYSIDISSAGFSTILSVSVIAIRNTATANTSPNVSIKTKSTTAIVVNVVEDNLNTITILGINVLSGSPSVFANVTGLTLDVTVIGY